MNATSFILSAIMIELAKKYVVCVNLALWFVRVSRLAAVSFWSDPAINPTRGSRNTPFTYRSFIFCSPNPGRIVRSSIQLTTGRQLWWPIGNKKQSMTVSMSLLPTTWRNRDVDLKLVPVKLYAHIGTKPRLKMFIKTWSHFFKTGLSLSTRKSMSKQFIRSAS